MVGGSCVIESNIKIKMLFFLLVILPVFHYQIPLHSEPDSTLKNQEIQPVSTHNQDAHVQYLIDSPDIRQKLTTIMTEIKKTEQSLALLWNAPYMQSILDHGPFCSHTFSPHTWLLQKIVGHNGWLKMIDKNGISLGIYDTCQSALSALGGTAGLCTGAYTLLAHDPLSIYGLMSSLYALPIMTFFACSLPIRLWNEPIKKIERYKSIAHNCGIFLRKTEELKKLIESDNVLQELTQSFDMLDIESWASQKIIHYKHIQNNQHPELLNQSKIDVALLNNVTATLTGLEHDIKTFKQYACALQSNTFHQSNNVFNNAINALKLRFFSYNACSAFKILLDIKDYFSQLIQFVNTIDKYLALAHQDATKTL